VFCNLTNLTKSFSNSKFSFFNFLF
jgi:hypothetical protein